MNYKIILLTILFSVILTFTMEQFSQILGHLVHVYEWMVAVLSSIFAGSMMGEILKKTIALLCIPLGCVALPALAYGLATRKALPNLTEIWLVLWFITITAVTLQTFPS